MTHYVLFLILFRSTRGTRAHERIKANVTANAVMRPNILLTGRGDEISMRKPETVEMADMNMDEPVDRRVRFIASLGSWSLDSSLNLWMICTE